MRCLIIDNYDSFTWNLADYVSQTFGEVPLVVRNDELSWREIVDRGPFDAIVVSPGPGSVTNSDDLNTSRDALEQDDVPVLGVCFGHQGLAYVSGGVIEHAPVPFHGRRSRIHHDGSGLFVGLPPVFDAVRYHSLVVREASIPADLTVTARTECGLVMGLRHVRAPKWGVQFHPESILTEHGMRMIANFRDEARRRSTRAAGAPRSRAKRAAVPAQRVADRRLKVYSRALPAGTSPVHAFVAVCARERNSFWLDSQIGMAGTGRMSFMGVVEDGDVLVHRIAGGPADAAGAAGAAVGPGALHLEALRDALERSTVARDASLPFRFRGGYVGAMTYEAKALFGGGAGRPGNVPDSVWMKVERFLAFDAETQRAWLVAVDDDGASARVEAWMDAVEAKLRSAGGDDASTPPPLGRPELSVAMDFGRDDYHRAIDACRRKIVDGESYQVCLTNSFCAEVDLDPVALYLTMRARNPAPFGAFLRVGSYCVVSTSPERFLRVDEDGTAQTKPIKGTGARSDDPVTDRENAVRLAASEKDRAENLMIVDLMRNDLARVSLPGTVRVPKLMDIESFETVHQMVSTVESTLRPECGLVDVLRAVFPGGSITGAPKVRTMQILDRVEQSPRGAYCGSVGYLGYDRVADLNIAIRTLSYDGTTIRFGAGGAITYLSQPESEFEEVLLKAEALLRPLWAYVNGATAPFRYELKGKTIRFSADRPAGGTVRGMRGNERGRGAGSTMRFVSVNGVESDACSVRDRGLQYGDGLFETMLCIDGQLVDFHRHVARLRDGCARLGIECPNVEAPLLEAAARWGQGRAVAKLVVTRGSGERGYRCPEHPVPTVVLSISDAPKPVDSRTGVDVTVCRTRASAEDEQLVGVKHLNRLPQVLARREWADEYHDGLMLDLEGDVVEAVTSNVFIVTAGRIETPDLGRCGVRGIVRQKVLDHARDLGSAIHVGRLSLEDVLRADEVFLTNSIHGVVPVAQVGERRYAVGPVATRLATEIAHDAAPAKNAERT